MLRWYNWNGKYLAPEEVTSRTYTDNPSTESAELPSEVVPKLLPIVHPASDITDVDGYIPGCPPKERVVGDILIPLVNDRAPEVPKKVFVLIASVIWNI